MSATPTSRRARQYCCAVVVSAIAVLGSGLATSALADPDAATDPSKTATPIKHVIVVIGENRRFDHVYATYSAPAGESVLNLLSEGWDDLPGSGESNSSIFSTIGTPIAILR